jgi:twitching motility protein PilT
MGAVEHQLDDRPAASGDRFTVVAARGGDDIWIELRRHRRLRAASAAAAGVAAAPEPVASTTSAGAGPTAAPPAEVAAPPVVNLNGHPVTVVAGHIVAPVAAMSMVATPEPTALSPVPMPVFEDDAAVAAPPALVAAPPPVVAPAGLVAPAPTPTHVAAPAPIAEPRVAYRHEPTPAPAPPVMSHTAPPLARYEPPSPESVHYATPEPQPTLPGLPPAVGGGHAPEDGRLDSPDAIPAVVLSLTRDSARSGGAAAHGAVRPGGIERLLRLAAARGASALYLTTQARPAVRVDGDIRLLDGEPALSSGDVEAAVLELAPEGARDKESAEWIRDLADVGRVRITTFRDYRGPGALLRMISARATSAEQLGLVREIQALATEPEGLVIVTGPRASGKSTMVSAFVDLINRQRNDYVITLEGQIRLVHESRGSIISQREVRGGAAEIVTAARTALRESPDVLVIEDLRSPDVLQAALDAAGAGLLVSVSVTAASATAALERLVDLCPSEQRRNVRAALAEHLRGVVAQVLLRKAGGGRLAARELVLNTNAVAALVSDGQIAQLPRAIDSGRKLGMAPLNDALVAFVQSGAVDVREAYRKADDQVGLLALLRREGIDTSFVERLA